MKINIISIGKRMPAWVNNGYQEYAKRLNNELTLNLIELPLEKRSKNTDVKRCVEHEGKNMLAAIPQNDRVIALDVNGHSWSTEQLAVQLQKWCQDRRNVSLLIGGPDGLAPHCITRAENTWSLSLLTFPHPLVRIIVAEQIYRAWSILKQHPYHRD